MSSNAYLPCFVCGTELPNVTVDCDNQPCGGTVFATEGGYGSTFWDSFDGEQLVLNVCDPCLRDRTDRLGQQKTHLPVRCAGMTGFGRVEVTRPLLAWTGNPDTEQFCVDIEDLGGDCEGVTVQWVPDIAERKAALLRDRISRTG